MHTSLVQQIESVRRQMERRRILAASCWALAALLVAALVLSSFDRAFGVQDSIGRSLLTLVGIAAAIVVGRRWVRATVCRKVSALEVAHRAEKNQPRLRDLITSALQFSSQAKYDPWAGSPTLRQATVLQATSAANNIAWQQLAPRKPLQKATLSFTGMLLVVLLVAWWTPQGLSAGFMRLVNPLNAVDWPRQVDLQLIDAPAKLAAGDDLILTVINTSGPLPKDTQVHFRVWQNDRWNLQSKTIPTTDQIGSVSRSNIQESLEIRATGGDHQTMPWYKIEVVPPPCIEEIKIVAHPPGYIHSTPRFWNGVRPLLAGSQLEIRGTTDQPMYRVALRYKDGQESLATLDEAGRKFDVTTPPLQASMSGLLGFAMTTREGISTHAKQQYILEVVPDEPPEVAIFVPTNDRLILIPEAQLPIVVEARDNIQLKSIGLILRETGAKPQAEQKITLWQSPGHEPDSPKDIIRKNIKRVATQWTPASSGFLPGALLEITALASDFQPAESRSERTLHISIVSKEELHRLYGQAIDPHTGTQAENKNQGDGKTAPGDSQQTGATPGRSKSSIESKNNGRTLAAAAELVRDLWGSLPAREQQQILQPMREDFMPQYVREIEEYYRALADPDRQRRESP